MRLWKTAKNAAVPLGCAVMLAGLIAYPSGSVEAAKRGLDICLELIIPSLFPFFVLSSMAIELGLAGILGKAAAPLMRRLFRLDGTCALPFLLGFIGGYPVGARAAISMYGRGELSKGDAERLLAFCNNSGPAFILGVVGAGVFRDSEAGLLLYLVHFISSVIVGLLFRGCRPGCVPAASEKAKDAPAEKKRFGKVVTSGVSGAFSSVLGICGFDVIFSVVIKLLVISGLIPAAAGGVAFVLGPLGVKAATAEELISGMIEMTSGVSALRGAAGSLGKNAVMAAFMLGWAGLSVHFQVLSFLAETGLSSKTYILGKLLHGVVSALLAALVFSFYSPSADVALVIADEIGALSAVRAPRAALLSLTGALPLAPLFAAAAIKRAREARRLLK